MGVDCWAKRGWKGLMGLKGGEGCTAGNVGGVATDWANGLTREGVPAAVEEGVGTVEGRAKDGWSKGLTRADSGTARAGGTVTDCAEGTRWSNGLVPGPGTGCGSAGDTGAGGVGLVERDEADSGTGAVCASGWLSGDGKLLSGR